MKNLIWAAIVLTASSLKAQTWNAPAIGISGNSDVFSYQNYSVGHYSLGWYKDAWDDSPTAYLSGYSGLKFFTRGQNKMCINPDGNVGIGTESPAEKLSVNGKIRAKEIKVEAGWSDFVFLPDYYNRSLNEVETFIAANKHLPDIPSAKEVAENGINVGEMNAKLLQKIEELTLHLIEMNKKVNKQQEEINELRRNNQKNNNARD